jgi:hypothetical protein
VGQNPSQRHERHALLKVSGKCSTSSTFAISLRSFLASVALALFSLNLSARSPGTLSSDPNISHRIYVVLAQILFADLPAHPLPCQNEPHQLNRSFIFAFRLHFGPNICQTSSIIYRRLPGSARTSLKHLEVLCPTRVRNCEISRVINASIWTSRIPSPI